jgi:hypothetical protein
LTFIFFKMAIAPPTRSTNMIFLGHRENEKSDSISVDIRGFNPH